MSKISTPAMEKLRRKNRYNVTGVSTPGKEAWKRLRKNKMAMAGLAIIVVLLLIALFANLLAPYDYREQDYSAVLAKPDSVHPFGCDQLGRDLLSRCIYGTRYSLPIGILCVCIGLLTGGLLGLIAAYFGGTVDNVIMRLMDIIRAVPNVLLCIALVATFGNGMPQLIAAMSVGSIAGMVTSVRSSVFFIKNADYVESSKSIGVSNMMIMLRHLLPNAVGMIVINAVGGIAGNILTVSTLSYIGIGLTSPTPEWGAILSDGKTYLSIAPHVALFPGLCIAITVVAFNLFGNGLRDALDPRLK